MTEKEYMELLNGINKAEESTTPFQISTEDSIVVVGDANETQINSHNFVVTFKTPSPDGYVTNNVEYKDIYITPRQETKVIRVMTDLLPFFKKIQENGTVGKYSDEEIAKLVVELGEEIYDRMYDLVGTVLNIDPAIRDYMTLGSVMTNTGIIFYSYPEMVNEASTFFQKSSDGRTIKSVK